MPQRHLVTQFAQRLRILLGQPLNTAAAKRAAIRWTKTRAFKKVVQQRRESLGDSEFGFLIGV